MLDIELLRSFVSVVDAGGFTRAGERVHRTQSTVSQQIRRLEESVGKPLLVRDGKRATPTEEGERLLTYARRILALAQEAQDVVARPVVDGVVRLGLPEDFAAYRLVELLSDYVRGRPTLRLDVRSGLSATLQILLDRGELDVALVKRNVGQSGGAMAWPERLQWVTSRKHPIDLTRDPVPIAVAEQGCLYRNRLIHALESAGRTWHVAYTSPNLSGIQAAAAVGLGIAILPDVAIRPEHRIVDTHGFAPIDKTEIALVVSDNANAAARKLAERLADICNMLRPSQAA
ncbi:MAG TPA: LysR substrate-binding domain-containing protein [Pseudolabrys sp.]|jgi:DNA-binding transcriptional LysR family regulator